MRFFLRALILSCSLCIISTVACAAGKTPATAETTEKYDSLKRFSKVFELLREAYVTEVSTDKLMEGAIKGMLQSLDPHSVFLSVSEFKEMQETTSGKFYGIGIEVSMEANQLIVVSPIEDTPAFKAGLKAGDFILAVNNELTQDLSLQEAVSKIRGEKGSEVELLILHKEEKSPVSVKIKRDEIPLISVKSRFLDEDGFAWIRLTRFNENSLKEMTEAIKNLESKASIKGIVLDLRNNPGGLLDESVKVASLFIPDGTIVSMRGRTAEDSRELKAKRGANQVKCPVVVLVNSGSASAAEIVAGALQDQRRALVVGEKTFGKGSVQKIMPLGDGSGVKLTIARFYTPSGRSIQAEGIVPDIEVPFEAKTESDDKKSPFSLIREKDLTRHLEGKDEKAEKNKGEAGKPKLDIEKDTVEMLAKDNQLRMALQLVRGLPKLSLIHAE